MERLTVSIDFDELRELRERIETADKALDRIHKVISDRREDVHGNAESRGEWLDRILSETKSALASCGYSVYKMPFTMPEFPALVNGEADTAGIDMPDFVRVRP